MGEPPLPIGERRDPARQTRRRDGRDGGRRALDHAASDVKWLTIAEVAVELRVSIKTVWKWIGAGHLRAPEFPERIRRVSRVELDAFVVRHLPSECLEGNGTVNPGK